MGLTRLKQQIFFLTLSAAFPAMAADDTTKRLENAANVFNSMTESEHGIKPEQLAAADCVAVIPEVEEGRGGGWCV